MHYLQILFCVSRVLIPHSELTHSGDGGMCFCIWSSVSNMGMYANVLGIYRNKEDLQEIFSIKQCISLPLGLREIVIFQSYYCYFEGNHAI